MTPKVDMFENSRVGYFKEVKSEINNLKNKNEDLDRLAYKSFQEQSYDIGSDGEKVLNAFIDGYKSAEAKQYTEEQVLNIIENVRSLKYMDGSKAQYAFTNEEILQSLKNYL